MSRNEGIALMILLLIAAVLGAIRGLTALAILRDVFRRRARWVEVFRGDYPSGSRVLRALEAEGIPAELNAAREQSEVIVRVLSSSQTQATAIVAKSKGEP